MFIAPEGLWQLLEASPYLQTLEGAEEFLRVVDSSVSLLLLYRHYFPDDFVLISRQRADLPDEEQTYSDGELEFFKLVDTHLFPLGLEWVLEDIYDARTFASLIPVAPFGLDFYGGYGDTPAGWLLLLYLIGTLNEDALRSYEACQDNRLFAIPLPRSGQVSVPLLEARSAAQGGPLANLHVALAMLYHDTDTIWLDMTANDLEFNRYYWTQRDVDRLLRQYQRAQSIQEEAAALCDWLVEDPVPRFAKVARLWTSCIQDTLLDESPSLVLPAVRGAA